MCLNGDQASKVAKRDLVVFKCMDIHYSQYLFSFYYRRNQIYYLNKTYTAPSCRLINEGGFYSFLLEEHAKDWRNSIERDHLKIFKCIIPKGSRYIQGQQDDFPCVRSKKIIFKKEVK